MLTELDRPPSEDYLDSPSGEPRYRCRPGMRYTKRMPFSEVCLHFRKAGLLMEFELTVYWCERQHYWSCSVQLFNQDGSKFSSAILPSEAGLYYEDDWDRPDLEPPQFYFYPNLG